jgi:hypothetical protein
VRRVRSKQWWQRGTPAWTSSSLLHDMFGSVFKDVTYKVEDTTHGPGGWLLRARESVTQERGMKLEWEEFLVVQFEGGLVRRLWVFYELGAAERQAGLDE